MDILSYFEYTEQNKLEVKYLIDLAEKIEVIEESKMMIINNQLKFLDGKRIETFAVFHKRILIEAILFKLTSRFIEEYKGNNFEIILEYYSYWKDPESNLVKFILQNNLSELTADEIYEIFEEKIFIEIKG